MREAEELTGVVLLARPIGEYDKRCVLLTREMGKITAFARGARRQNSPNLAATNPFVFARFKVYAGRDAYTLLSAEVSEYFTELSARQPEVYYGFYFLDLAAYFGREGIEAAGSVNLLYVALKALLRGTPDAALVRRIFELRLFAENGLYAPPEKASPELAYTLQYILTAPVVRLFSFSLKEEVERELFAEAEKALKRVVDRRIKSLEVLRQMTQ